MAGKIEFFAVTTGKSLYRATENSDDPNEPIVEKIAGLFNEEIPVGMRLNRGTKIGITNYGLIRYFPDIISGFRIAPAGMCSTNFHGGKTSPIVGLFLNEERAQYCLRSMENHDVNFDQWDKFWGKYTTETLEAIGFDHNIFIIDPDLRAPK